MLKQLLAIVYDFKKFCRLILRAPLIKKRYEQVLKFHKKTNVIALRINNNWIYFSHL